MDPIAMLEKRRDAFGLSGTAKQLAISPAYLCDILKGRREPGPKVLKALGLEREVRYKKANGRSHENSPR